MASSSHLNPGEKGGIIARVDTGGRKGLVHKTVKVLSNDPGRPVVSLSLRAMIK
jgi:hypothetical protein